MKVSWILPTPALLVAFLAVAALHGCGSRVAVASSTTSDLVTRTSPSLRTRRVVLVTVDGLRWQDVFEGSDPALSGEPRISPAELMPRVTHLVATRGVAIGAPQDGCGTARTAGGTNVSLPGYLEIFTGRPSYCLDNDCTPVEDTVLDEASRAGLRAASIGSWGVLERAVSGGAAGGLVSAGRRWPADRKPEGALAELVSAGANADPYPGTEDYRPDAFTAAIALEYYRVTAPPLFHIGLGDTDEYGHRGDYAAYLDAIRRSDATIGALADRIAAMGADGEATVVIITPDHGRNSDFRDHGALRPESARTFLLAFGGGIPVRGIACATHDVTLADIAPTIRSLLGLPQDSGPGAGTPIELIAGFE